MNNNNYLIIDCVGSAELQIMEAASPNRLCKFQGKFQEYNAINKNNRIYPEHVLKSSVDKLVETVNARGLVGELDHPADSIVHFENASHVITRLWWENCVLMGEAECLPTPAGQILKALIEAGVRVGISSRGIGSGQVNNEGVTVIGENYKLITFDAVSDPSTYSAFQNKVNSKNNKMPIMSSENSEKNESVGINKLNPDVLICYLNQYMKDIKSKLITEKRDNNE